MGRKPAAKPQSSHLLSINTKFAQQYDVSKRRQLLSNAPSALLHSDDSSSSSEEDDEFGELLTKKIDNQVRNTLEAIRNKDPRIYDKDLKFFNASAPAEQNEQSGDSDSDDEPVAGWHTIEEAAKQNAPKLTLKDYVRETLLNDGKLSDSDDETPHEHGHNAASESTHTINNANSHPISFHTDRHSSLNPQQPQVQPESHYSDVDDNDATDFFTKKDKTEMEMEEEDKDFGKFLLKQARKSSNKAGEDLLLHAYLEKESPDVKEAFLRDFVLNNGWLDKNAVKAPGANDYTVEVDLPDADLSDGHQSEQDNQFDEKNDDFEAKYNFRFEDPDSAQIISHARNVPESVRRPDERRKRAREARRLRKQQEKAAKIEDISRLKHLKKKEIRARLSAIQEAAGDVVDTTAFDLDGDFDPEEFNKQMEKSFGDEYYARTDEKLEKLEEQGIEAIHQKPSVANGSDDPEDIGADVNRMIDEYYNLNYEDIIDGVPVRFKYKKVEPESFNMTAEEVLTRDDKELNRVVSLKYLAPYRSQREVKKKAWKTAAALKKHRRTPRQHGNGHTTTEFGVSSEAGESTNSVEQSDKKKRTKKRKGEGTQPVDENTTKLATEKDSGKEIPIVPDRLKAVEEGKAPVLQNGDDKSHTSSQRKRRKKKSKNADSSQQPRFPTAAF